MTSSHFFLRPALFSLIACIALLAACTPEETPDDEVMVDMSSSQDMPTMPSPSPDADMSPDTPDQSAPIEDLGAPDMPPTQDMEQEPPADMGPEFVELPEKPWDISVRGPYEVGYSTASFTYTSKPYDEVRTIDVVFWYPTLDAKGERARYMREIVQVGKSFKEASIPSEPATFPMLVFSHGNSSIAEQSFTFTEHFASHGWVVVAPYHQDNSIFDNVGSINYLSSVYRPQDITALLDWTSALTAADHPLAGRMDHDKIILSGHSFGAFTTMAISGAQFDLDAVRGYCDAGTIKPALCELFGEDYEALFQAGFHDPRIKAAIPQTPGIGKVFEDGVAQIDIPMLMMTARRDVQLPTEENGIYMWQRMNDGPHALFDMPNAGHFTYSDMCNLFGSAIEQARDDGCNETFVSADVALPIINHYGLAWAEYHLLGETRHEALISGETRPYSMEDLVYITKAEESMD